MTAESIISPTTVVANGVAVTTAAPLPVTLVGGVSPTTLALGTPITGGATNQLLYADGTSTLAEVTKANSQVLVTNSSGVPAWSATLPSGLAATSMALTTPAIGVATGTSLNLGGATLGANVLAVNGTALINGATTIKVATATTNAVAGVNSNATAYNMYSLNGVVTDAGFIGIMGGGSGDHNMFVQAESGGSVSLRVAGTNVATFGGSSITFSQALALTNTVTTTNPTSPNRTITVVVNGVTLYIAAKTTND